jgi:hypothetical protein
MRWKLSTSRSDIARWLIREVECEESRRKWVCMMLLCQRIRKSPHLFSMSEVELDIASPNVHDIAH